MGIDKGLLRYLLSNRGLGRKKLMNSNFIIKNRML